MRILAGPENWTFITDFLRLALDGHDVLTFNDRRPGLRFTYPDSTFHDVLEQLPDGWEPELVIWWLPEFQSVLPGIDECPYPTLLLVSDWHVVSDPLIRITSMFDLVGTDLEGLDLLSAAPDVTAFHAPLYGFNPHLHRRLDDCPPRYDVSHVGDLHPYLHRDRVRALATVGEALGHRQVRFFEHVYGEDYVKLVNSSRITINFALRGELSMRCYEAPACGSLLFCEDSNREVRRLFKDREHCVLYNQDNLVELLEYYLDHEDERAAIAEAGHRLVQDYSYPRQGRRLLEQAMELLPHRKPRRAPSARDFADYCYHVFNRDKPLPALKALERAPADPLALNLKGCTLARAADMAEELADRQSFQRRAIECFERCLELGLVVHLNLATTLLQDFQPERAVEVLEQAEGAPFHPVAFYPRSLDPVMVLWEKERHRREDTARWRLYDMLAELVPERALEYSQRALHHRADLAITWFRSALNRPLEAPERAAELERAVACDPSFFAARFALARTLWAQGRRSETTEFVGRTSELIVAYPTAAHVPQEMTRTLGHLSPVPRRPQPAKSFDALEAYLQGLRFEWLRPDHPIPTQVYDRQGRGLEFTNTILPLPGPDFMKLQRIPRMSTIAVAAVLNRAVSQMPDDRCYVNVGVWHGFTFLGGLLDNPGKRCVGIDNFSQFGGPREAFLRRFEVFKGPTHGFHEMDYRDYFAGVHQGPIGLYLYDGEHSYDNQLQGLKVAEPFFEPGTIVVVDDTNWEEPRQATLDFVEESSRKYQLLFDIKTADTRHPTWWNGLMVWRCLE